MSRKKLFNMLMYSHDTYGLGHIRRSMAIAMQLRGPDINSLIITGSPLVGRFSLPEQIDFVRIPGMIKKTNEVYLPLSIKLSPQHALHIREQIIKTTTKCFLPDMFIVDKEPLGLKKEVLITLKWIRKHLPHCRTVLGLRDIMDDAYTIRRDWEKRGIYDILESLYDEIWVYGNQEFYDPVKEYAIPTAVSKKIVFTGYIPRKVPKPVSRMETRKELGFGSSDKVVLVTLGGGGDGYLVIDTFLKMLETGPPPFGFKTILLTGPFMPKDKLSQIHERASRLSLVTYRFYRQTEKLIAAADLIVTMGGYNTICEILAQKKVALVIPRESPRQEQLIRARVMKENQLLDFIGWNDLTPEILRDSISHLLSSSDHIKAGMKNFQMTGIQIMSKRLNSFRSNYL